MRCARKIPCFPPDLNHRGPAPQQIRGRIRHLTRSRYAAHFAALGDGILLGWAGGLPEYDGRVWELHPIVVRRECRLRGIGRSLVSAFEEEAQRRGALTVTLGTDDDSRQTSAAGVDLYDDLPRHLAELRDLGDRHPFLFYRRLGYTVTGIMPDANGPGRPDIYMSKRAGPGHRV